jgi:hypothetical protein
VSRSSPHVGGGGYTEGHEDEGRGGDEGREGRYEPGLHLCVKLDYFRRGFLWENIYYVG